MEASTANSGSVDADVQKAMQMAISATEKKDYKSALTLFNHIYGNPSLEAPVDGLSYYGLCVAVGEKQTKKGIELCQEAMRQQFYDSRHHSNLVRLHLAKGNRRHACHSIEESLKRLPGDKRLVQLRAEMGVRGRNPIPFLPRDNSLNRWIGIRRRGQKNRRPDPVSQSGGFSAGSSLQNLQPIQMLLFGFLGFATVFSITFYILYQRAYG